MQSRARLQQLSRGCVALVVLAVLAAQNPLWDALAPGAPAPWRGAAADVSVKPPAPGKVAVLPLTDSHLPSLTATVTVTPDPVVVGQPATVALKITNGGANAASDLRVTLPALDGAEANGGTGVAAAGGWEWSQGTLAPHSDTTFTAPIRVTRLPKGDALVVTPTVTAKGLVHPLTVTGGALVTEPTRATAARAAYSPEAASSLTSGDGRLRVDLPANAHPGPLALRHETTLATSENAPRAAGLRGGLEPFALHATDGSGQEVHQFAAPLTLTYSYSAEQLAARGIASARDLTLFWYNPDAPWQVPGTTTIVKGTWVPIETQVDEGKHTATARVDHFSQFKFADGSSPSTDFIPSVDGWQVSLFTGAATYSMPFALPAGPGGLKPALALSYTSADTDGKSGQRPNYQAGWAGKGWSLGNGYVARRKISSTPPPGFYESYTLNLGGREYDLVNAGLIAGHADDGNADNYLWKTVDDPSVKVQAVPTLDTTYPNHDGYHGSDPYYRITWQLWTVDGTRYDYTDDLWWGLANCTYHVRPDGSVDHVDGNSYMEAYRWNLTTVTEPHGNTVSYTYGHTSNSDQHPDCGDAHGTTDVDSWPSEITWGGNPGQSMANHYRVIFANLDRAYDTQADGDGTQYDAQWGGHPRQTRVLQAVEVDNLAAGNWQVLSQWRFDETRYLYSDQTVDGNNTPVGPTGIKYGLGGIQRLGTDAYPITEDTSGGGKHSLVGVTGTPLPMTLFGYGLDSGGGEFATGGWNRLTTVNNGEGGTVTFTYEEIGAYYLGQNLPYQGRNFRNYQRVTTRTVTDGVRGHPAVTWTYSYTQPELNSRGVNAEHTYDTNYQPNSAKLYYAYGIGNVAPNVPASDLLAVPQRTEFRGHAEVDVTDPAGNVTKHFFYQGDLLDAGQAACTLPQDGLDLVAYNSDPCFQQLRNNEFFRGKEYKTEVWGAGSAGHLSTTQRTYAFNNFSFSCGANQCISGLWSGFTYLSQETATILDSTGSGTSKTTAYTYTSTSGAIDPYGDLLQTDEYAGATGTEVAYRTTKYGYAPITFDSVHYGNRRVRTQILDGATNAVVAQTDNGYGAGGLLTTDGIGDLTLTRVYFAFGSGGGTNGSDTRYSYDGYGNQITSSTYSGGNGTGTERKTTTTYDPVFHVFPEQVTYPPAMPGAATFAESAGYDLAHGYLTSITDLNGQMTTATYDTFGRLATLVKPGDTTGPSLAATYYDLNPNTGEPMHYVVALRDTANQVHNVMTWYDGRGRVVQTKKQSAYDGSQVIVSDARSLEASMQAQAGTPRYLAESSSTLFTYETPPGSVQWTTTTADALGRTTQVTYPDGTSTQTRYAPSNAGETTTTIDANGHQSDAEHDVFGHAITTNEYTGTASTGFTKYATTAAAYDVLGRQLTLTDAQMHTLTHQYGGNATGPLTTITDADTGTSTAQADANGNVVRTTDANMHTVGSGYDAWNRLIAQTGDLTASYVYDTDGTAGTYPVGRLVSTTTGASGAPLSTVHTLYDLRGRTASTTETIGGTNATTGMTYDSGDRLTSLTYPGLETVNYLYDAAGRPTSVCQQGTSLCYAGNVTYTALSQPATESLGNGLQEAWGYDGTTQRLSHHQIGTSIPASGNADRFDRGYLYDKIGNVQTITLNSIGDTAQFGYDELNRLVTATDVGHPEWAESDSYDTVGNLTAKTTPAGTTPYTYTNASHPHAVSSVGTDSYTYDLMGNTLSGGGRQYTWNAQGLPSSITSALAGSGAAPTATPGGPAPNTTNSRVQGSTAPGPVGNTSNRVNGTTAAGPVNNTAPVRPGGTGGTSSTETYTYDASGARLTRTVNGITTSYFGLYEKDSTGTERWFYRLGGQVVAQREHTGAGGDTRVWLGGDHLGSVSLVTSNTGSILSSTEYSPWGQARGGSGTKPTALDYTGQHRDGTGLIYLGSRYYDPVLGRFLSPDSVVDGVNPYSYLHNNPLNGTDPTGHCDDCERSIPIDVYTYGSGANGGWGFNPDPYGNGGVGTVSTEPNEPGTGGGGGGSSGSGTVTEPVTTTEAAVNTVAETLTTALVAEQAAVTEAAVNAIAETVITALVAEQTSGISAQGVILQETYQQSGNSNCNFGDTSECMKCPNGVSACNFGPQLSSPGEVCYASGLCLQTPNPTQTAGTGEPTGTNAAKSGGGGNSGGHAGGGGATGKAPPMDPVPPGSMPPVVTGANVQTITGTNPTLPGIAGVVGRIGGTVDAYGLADGLGTISDGAQMGGLPGAVRVGIGCYQCIRSFFP